MSTQIDLTASLAKATVVPEPPTAVYIKAGFKFNAPESLLARDTGMPSGTVSFNGEVKIRFYGLSDLLRNVITPTTFEIVEKDETTAILLADPSLVKEYLRSIEDDDVDRVRPIATTGVHQLHEDLHWKTDTVTMVSLILTSAEAGGVLALETGLGFANDGKDVDEEEEEDWTMI